MLSNAVQNMYQSGTRLPVLSLWRRNRLQGRMLVSCVLHLALYGYTRNSAVLWDVFQRYEIFYVWSSERTSEYLHQRVGEAMDAIAKLVSWHVGKHSRNRYTDLSSRVSGDLSSPFVGPSAVCWHGVQILWVTHSLFSRCDKSLFLEKMRTRGGVNCISRDGSGTGYAVLILFYGKARRYCPSP